MSARTHERFPTARQLALIAAVVDHGGVVAAASTLSISQPAVTAQLRAAERALGHRLFRRTQAGLVPTAAGRAVAAYARRQTTLIRSLVASLAGLKDGKAASLSLAAGSTPAEYWLPQRVTEFRRRHAGVEVRVAVVNSDEALDLLASGAVDAAVTGLRKRLRGVTFVEVARDRVVAVGAPRSRWTRGIMRPRTLADATFIVREEGSSSRPAGLAALRRAGVAPRRLMPLSSNEAVARMAAADLGIGLISERAAQAHLAAGRVAPVRVYGFHCATRLFVGRRNDAENRLVDDFIALALAIPFARKRG